MYQIQNEKYVHRTNEAWATFYWVSLWVRLWLWSAEIFWRAAINAKWRERKFSMKIMMIKRNIWIFVVKLAIFCVRFKMKRIICHHLAIVVHLNTKLNQIVYWKSNEIENRMDNERKKNENELINSCANCR